MTEDGVNPVAPNPLFVITIDKSVAVSGGWAPGAALVSGAVEVEATVAVVTELPGRMLCPADASVAVEDAFGWLLVVAGGMAGAPPPNWLPLLHDASSADESSMSRAPWASDRLAIGMNGLLMRRPLKKAMDDMDIGITCPDP